MSALAASIIFFSPYQQWNGVDITYKIQKLINGIWLTVNNEKVNADYLDNQFLNKLEFWQFRVMTSLQFFFIVGTHPPC